MVTGTSLERAPRAGVLYLTLGQDGSYAATAGKQEQWMLHKRHGESGCNTISWSGGNSDTNGSLLDFSILCAMKGAKHIARSWPTSPPCKGALEETK